MRARQDRPAPARRSPNTNRRPDGPAPLPAVHVVAPVAPPPVVAATPADLEYVVHLQKRHADALGFIPRVALREKIDLGRIRLARENGEPAGFLHHGSLARPEVRVFQAAIQYDVRRRHLGLALVDDVVSRAAAHGARGVSLRCLSFLEANEFWEAADFELLTTEPGAKGTLNVWVKRLTSGGGESAPRSTRADAAYEFAFSSRIHPCPGGGAATVDPWVRGGL
jgi:hypothetical protein